MRNGKLSAVRNTNIEVFRFVLMIGILLWHLIIHGCGFSDIGNSDYKYSIQASIIGCALFAPAVNCFMFISGWFGMRFRASKTMNLSLICILSAMLCLVIRHYALTRGGHDISLMNLYSAIFPISTKAWWFMTAYVMVLLISPFIEKSLKVIDKKDFIYVLIFMTLIEVLSLPSMRNWGSSFFGLLYIYMLGRYLRTYSIIISKRKALILFLGMTVLMIASMEALNYLPIKKSSLFYFLQFNNPIIILQAIGFFSWYLI